MCRRDAILDPWVRGLEERGVRIHRIDMNRPIDFAVLHRLMRTSDLVHLVLAYPTGKYQLAAALLAWAARRPLIATHQLVVDVRDIPMSAARRAFWRVAFRCYRWLARANIASSRAGWELLVRRYGFMARSTILIYNGANLSMFKPLGDAERRAVRDAIASELAGERWTADILFACTVARLSVQKGLPDLVQAAAEVVRALPNARFILVGDGELREPLLEQVATLGLQRHVLLAGSRPLSLLPSWLGAADLFVLSSHNEGMPLSLIEAMAAACPVVATDVGGVPDVVGDSKGGILVKPKDPHALAAAVTRVLADPNERRVMSEAARERAVSTFDVRTCYQKTIELYSAPRPSPARAEGDNDDAQPPRPSRTRGEGDWR